MHWKQDKSLINSIDAEKNLMLYKYEDNSNITYLVLRKQYEYDLKKKKSGEFVSLFVYPTASIYNFINFGSLLTFSTCIHIDYYS